MRSLPFIYILFAFIGCHISKKTPSTIIKEERTLNDYNYINYTHTRVRGLKNGCFPSFFVSLCRSRRPAACRNTFAKGNLKSYHQFCRYFVLLALLGRFAMRIQVLLVVQADVGREIAVAEIQGEADGEAMALGVGKHKLIRSFLKTAFAVAVVIQSVV